jgi:hypothetical protein
MAAINGVPVAGTIVPTDTSDTYPVIDLHHAIDGHRSVADSATRDAIPAGLRRQGMTVAVQADYGDGPNCLWQLNAPPWNFDATDWIELVTDGISDAPTDGQVYGRSNANWIPVTETGGGGTPGGTSGQLQYNNNGAFGGLTMSGDATMDSTGNTTVSKTNGTPFGTLAGQNADAVAITSGTITGLPTPVTGSDAATKSYVDAYVQGLTVKTSCACATTPSGGNTTLSGLQTIDGYTTIVGDRVLVKNQTDATQNGVYIAATGAWVRAADFDSSSNIEEGSYFFINHGTTNISTAWVMNTQPPITAGTTTLNFVQYSAAGTYQADGNGIVLNGNIFSLVGVPGEISITSNGIGIDPAFVVNGGTF